MTHGSRAEGVARGQGPHADALEVLRTWRPPDAAQATLRQRFVDHLDENADGLLRSCLPDHITASTLVLDARGERVLLTLHAKAERWFQLGGHVHGEDRTLAAAARREAHEESGLEMTLDPVPVHLDCHVVPFCGATDGGPPATPTRHLDVRFLAVASSGTTRLSAESTDLRWWPVDALPSREDSLRRLVGLGRRRLLDG